MNYIYDFDNRVVDGTVRTGYRRIDLRKDHTKFPYPNNSVCKLVGKTPDYIGMVHGGVVKRRQNNHRILKSVLCDVKYKVLKDIYVDETVNYREVLSPGFNTGISQLKNYTSEPKIVRNVDEMLKIVEMSKYKWFRIPEIDEPDDEAMYDVNFNRKASPGHYTKNLVARKRQGSVKYTTQAAEDLYDFMKTTALKNFYLWEILGREKDNKIIEGNKVNSRIIMNTEEPMVLLLSMFSQRLSKVIQNDEDNSILIGKDLVGNVSKRIKNSQSYMTWTLESDWKLFDSNIQSSDIILAGSILLSNFDLFSKRMRRSMYLIISSIVTKYVVINPGFVLRIDKGVPSGHPFTSLITSVINLVYWCLIGYEIYGSNYGNCMDIYVQGDDANIMFRDHPNLNRLDEIVAGLGIECEPLNGTLRYNGGFKTIHDEPVLLKRKFNSEGIVWNRKSIIRKLIYQTSTTKTVEDDIDILRNYIYTAPDDDLMNEMLVDMMKVHFCDLKMLEIDKNRLLDEVKKYVHKKRIRNSTPNSVKIGLEFETGVQTKPEAITHREELKLVRLEREKYLLSLFICLPSKLMSRHGAKLHNSVKKRDLLYLNEYLQNGLPPRSRFKTEQFQLYRFKVP